MAQYEGVVTAPLISLRFPESGKLAWPKCYPPSSFPIILAPLDAFVTVAKSPGHKVK